MKRSKQNDVDNGTLSMDRRGFMSVIAVGGVIAGCADAGEGGSPPLESGDANGATPSGISLKYWIDPKLRKLPPTHWRKLHLDFHNSQYIPQIGERFDPSEFADTLVKANIDLIVAFAKDMHGYFYYPSRYGPVHRGLSFDLLGEQVKACRARNIAVHAYYCVTWDNYLAENHQGWLVINRQRDSYLPKFDKTPHWTALCLAHEDYVDLMLEHTREFVSRYDLDGTWFDMPVPINDECFCDECLRQLAGKDFLDKRVQAEHKSGLHLSFIKRIHSLIKGIRPNCKVEFNWQDLYGLRERLAYQDTIDIECVPTAFWTYYYLPMMMRYIRSFGVATRGLTGRFEGMWGDFGSLKLPAQIGTELSSMVANGARCNVGDQMPPDAKLDPAVYHVIGKSFEKIKEIEPYLQQAAPVTEAVMIISGFPLSRPLDPYLFGTVKLLLESQVQFDVMEPDGEWERYALVIIPDEVRVGTRLGERLHTFIEGGGAILASHHGGLLEDEDRSWLERYGFSYKGPSPFTPAYMVPHVNFTRDIPNYQYVLYEGASQWQIHPPATLVASLGVPAFQRSPEHYTGHQQSPFDHETEFAALARSGRVALFGFPIGLSYYNRGYWFYRWAFRHVIRELLTRPLVETNAPVTTEVTLTYQESARSENRPERYMVHLVNYSEVRPTSVSADFYEDPTPLRDIKVRLNLPFKHVKAKAVRAGADLSVQRTSAGGVEVVVPQVHIHEIVSFEPTV